MRPLVVISLLLVAVIGVVLFMFREDSAPSGTATPPAATREQPKPAGQPELARVAPDKVVDREVIEAPVNVENDDIVNRSVNNSLTGRVFDDQQRPLPNARVVLSLDPFMGEDLSMMWFLGKEPTGKQVETTTDAEGVYTFRSVEPASDYFMLADHADYRQTQEQLVSVGDSGEFAGPDMFLTEGALLSGYVVDVGENPVANAWLYLDSAYMMGTDPRSPDRIETYSDENGYYEMRNVGPGPRNLAVVADGYAMRVQHNLKFTGEPGEVIEQTFRLDLGHPIAGRVFGPQNEGIAGAKLMAMNYSNSQSSRGEAVTNENGEFQIDNLAQGSFNLMIDAKGYRVARHNRVQVGDLNVQVEMIKQACVSGRIVSDGEPVESFTATVFRSNPAGKDGGPPIFESIGVEEKFDVDANGNYTLCGLDGGTFRIKIRSKGLAPRMSEEFTVADGQVLGDLTIAMTRGGTIKGRLVAADGSAISGARITSHDDEEGRTNLDPFLGGLITTNTTQRKAKSDSEGNFELRLLNPGTYRIQVAHPNFTTELVGGISVREGATADAGSITLKPGGIVKGKVYNRAGELLPRGFVQLLRTDGDEIYTYQGRSNAQGAYAFEHVRPGSYKLSATSNSASGGGDAFGAIAEQQVSEVLINVVEGTAVTRDLNLGN